MLLNNLKILSTGNPTKLGIANQLSKEFPNCNFIFQSMGVDLSTEDGQNYFKSIIPNYNVFVNISNIKNNTQEKLLKLAHESGMKGHIFNIGSIAEYKKWEWYNTEYTNEKRQLRETSLNLCSENFKTTHIIVGGFQDYENSDLNRMDPKEVVNIIKYILSSPINIPIVGIEKIIDIETEKQLNGKLQNT